MKTSKRVLTGIAIALVAGLAIGVGTANAGIVVKPTAVDASSEITGWSSIDRGPEYTIDDSGISDSASIADGETEPDSWPAHGVDPEKKMWLSDDGDVPAQWIMFDLGESRDLEGMHVWNYNELTGSSMKEVDVEFATELDGTFGSTDDSDTGWGSADSMTFSEASGLDTYTGEDFDFSSTITARYVLFDARSNYSVEGGTRVGLSEVRFTAIPEPASLGLFGIVCGALWFVRRKFRDIQS